MAKPWKDLVAPLMADPERRAKIEKGAQEIRRSVIENRLAEVRKAQGVGQQELAERLNLSQASISNLENSADPKISTLTRYANALGGTLHISITVDDKETRIAG